MECGSRVLRKSQISTNIYATQYFAFHFDYTFEMLFSKEMLAPTKGASDALIFERDTLSHKPWNWEF